MSENEDNQVLSEEEEELVWLRRCKKCRRPTTKHPKPSGQRCNQPELTEAEMKEYERELKRQLEEEELQREQQREQEEAAAAVVDNSGRNANEGNDVMRQLVSLFGQVINMNQNNQSTESSGSERENQMNNLQQMQNMVDNLAPRGGRQARAGNRQQQQPQPPQQYDYRMYQPPVPVPVFNKDLSVEAWAKKIIVWNENHDHMKESMRMSMILDSLKSNEERKNLKSWIINNVEDDDNFDLRKVGIVDSFLELLKTKYDVSNWQKSQ